MQKPGWSSEPITLLSTGTAVWPEDNARYGVMRGDRLLVGAPGGPWSCFDAARDPGLVEALPPEKCGRLMQNAIETFPR